MQQIVALHAFPDVSILIFAPSQVTCIALLSIAHARAERDATKAAALKARRGSVSSLGSAMASAFDIQATVQLAAVLHRLMLVYNIIVPAVVLRFCKVP
jgi:hypothetical protein